MAEGRMSLPVVRRFGETSRRDLWWLQPVVVVTVLSSFVIYANWAAFQAANYTYGPYVSPFYSPLIFGDLEHREHSWFAEPSWWPWLISPAFLIMWGPAGFRVTCYYYRGAYYKAFWADPPSCGVGEPRKSYWGENHWPLLFQNIHRYFLYAALVIQNIHRYFMYVALLFLVFLSIDVIRALRFKDEATGAVHFGVGVGTLVLLLNVCLLGGYTFSCHSLRHVIGGGIDQLSRAPLRHKAYDCVSCLNRWHMWWAWFSLVWVGFSDLYVRLCSTHVIHDYQWWIT
jgi:hypothetical protein